MWLTRRIHRYLGIGFALLLLPISLGATGVADAVNAALWAPATARVLDTSLRYTVDKTTREILFLPLPPAMKLTGQAVRRRRGRSLREGGSARCCCSS